MRTKAITIVAVALLGGLLYAYAQPVPQAPSHFPVMHTALEWKKILPPESFYVMRQKGTEPPFANKYDNLYAKGTYRCAACGQVLFSSNTKFNSGTGWPSFWAPVSKKAVIEVEDNSMGMDRTEVICSRCGSHLGHVFDDGPKPTGLRYCMNSAALAFTPAKK